VIKSGKGEQPRQKGVVKKPPEGKAVGRASRRTGELRTPISMGRSGGTPGKKLSKKKQCEVEKIGPRESPSQSIRQKKNGGCNQLIVGKEVEGSNSLEVARLVKNLKATTILPSGRRPGTLGERAFSKIQKKEGNSQKLAIASTSRPTAGGSSGRDRRKLLENKGESALKLRRQKKTACWLMPCERKITSSARFSERISSHETPSS